MTSPCMPPRTRFIPRSPVLKVRYIMEVFFWYLAVLQEPSYEIYFLGFSEEICCGEEHNIMALFGFFWRQIWYMFWNCAHLYVWGRIFPLSSSCIQQLSLPLLHRLTVNNTSQSKSDSPEHAPVRHFVGGILANTKVVLRYVSLYYVLLLERLWSSGPAKVPVKAQALKFRAISVFFCSSSVAFHMASLNGVLRCMASVERRTFFLYNPLPSLQNKAIALCRSYQPLVALAVA